jgi:c-di-GMP-binding flagellar brake protein YcgR
MSVSDASYGVRFQVEGRTIEGARLANLSACGCGLEVQMAEVRHLDTGVVLEHFYLDHPDLPLVPLQASVVRILGKVAGKTHGYALVGVEFSLITGFVQVLIHEHVSSCMVEVES